MAKEERRSGTPRIGIIPISDIDTIWPKIKEGLEEACLENGGQLNSNYLWSQCRSGQAFLVVGAIRKNLVLSSVWRFEDWSSGRKLRCLALNANRNTISDWLPLHNKLARWLAEVGKAESYIVEGRPGWEKYFPKAKKLRTLYELRI